MAGLCSILEEPSRPYWAVLPMVGYRLSKVTRAGQIDIDADLVRKNQTDSELEGY